jgi:3-methyladenine DNA glycosylase AlkC
MEPFKELLGFEKVKSIAHSVQSVYPLFREQDFLKTLENDLPKLELKQRMELIAKALMAHLPQKVEKLFPILIESAKKMDGFLVWPHTHIINLRGLESGEQHLKPSLYALYEMTQVFTGEFAIRDFLIQYPDATLKILRSWLQDPSEHVRRLISEGTRPLLPWGKKIDLFAKDPTLTWDLLEELRSDPSPYVRKSVANHLNDHSKNHPDWLIKNLGRWKKLNDKNVDWVIRHASRTLIKRGNLKALALQGVRPVRTQVSKFRLSPKTLKLGNTLECTFNLKNLENKSVKIVLDQSVGFLKKNADLTQKVFKGKQFKLEAGETVLVVLKLPIRRVTTRVYYPGKHTYTLLLNGVAVKSINFTLRT